MISTATIRLANNCSKRQKFIAHCTDLGESMMEIINRQWLRHYGNARYFEHSVSREMVNLVNPDLTLLEQWQLKREQRPEPAAVFDDTLMHT